MNPTQFRPAVTTFALTLFACLFSSLTSAFDEPPSAPQPPPKPPTKPSTAKVVSSEKARDQSRRSQFLRPPGSGRYDDQADWSDIPAWRQTSFFGIRAQGQFFVYVVDCSGSMVEEDRLGRAKAEIRRGIWGMREPQKFKVIFYNDEPIPMPGDLPRSADLMSKNQLISWMRLIEPDGGTDPRDALAQAVALRPDAVFLLSDGEFPEGTVEAVARKNARKVPIHCVDLSRGEAAEQLKRIASQSGGKYVLRPRGGQ